jgi:sugar/nucleoside kinase (ribokinase family)
MDLIIRGVPRLPAWGTEVVGSSSGAFVAGQAGNLALGLRRLGVPTNVIGAVGSDPAGRLISAALSEAGVDIEGVEVSSRRATGISVAVVRADGERAFLSELGSGHEVDEALVRRHWDRVEASAVFCLVGLFNLPSLGLGAAISLAARARSQGCLTLLDTGWDPGGWSPQTISGLFRLLREIDVFLPNQDEAAAISGADDAATAAGILREAGPSTVVVKCGAEGSYGRSGDQVHRAPAMRVSAVDTVGAGDAYDAAFLRAHLAGFELARSMDFASRAAGLYVGRASDRFPTVEQIAAASDPPRASELLDHQP